MKSYSCCSPNVFIKIYPGIPQPIVDLASQFDRGETLSNTSLDSALGLLADGHSDSIAQPVCTELVMAIYPKIDGTKQARLIGYLLRPECSETLRQVLESGHATQLELDANLKETLVRIASVPDVAEKITIIVGMINPNPNPVTASPLGTMNSSMPQLPPRDIPNSKWRLEVGRAKKGEQVGLDPGIRALGEALANNDIGRFENLLKQTPNLGYLLLDAAQRGSFADNILVELLGHQNYQDTAIKAFHSKGASAIPLLQSLLSDPVKGPPAAKTISWIVEGNMPPELNKGSHTTQLDPRINQLVTNGDMVQLKSVLDNSPNDNSLVDKLAHSGAGVNKIMIDLLGDPTYREIAIRVLHNIGPSAIRDLQMAEADPQKQDAAREALRWIVTGDRSSNDSLNVATSSSLPGSVNSPAESFGGPPSGKTTNIAKGLLNSSELELLLKNPRTVDSTLRSLIQIGKPALPPLCVALLTGHRP